MVISYSRIYSSGIIPTVLPSNFLFLGQKATFKIRYRDCRRCAILSMYIIGVVPTGVANVLSEITAVELASSTVTVCLAFTSRTLVQSPVTTDALNAFTASHKDKTGIRLRGSATRVGQELRSERSSEDSDQARWLIMSTVHQPIRMSMLCSYELQVGRLDASKTCDIRHMQSKNSRNEQSASTISKRPGQCP